MKQAIYGKLHPTGLYRNICRDTHPEHDLYSCLIYIAVDLTMHKVPFTLVYAGGSDSHSQSENFLLVIVVCHRLGKGAVALP